MFPFVVVLFVIIRLIIIQSLLAFLQTRLFIFFFLMAVFVGNAMLNQRDWFGFEFVFFLKRNLNVGEFLFEQPEAEISQH